MNLIYYTIGNNINYINILNLNILTLEKYYNYNFELLFIIDERIANEFETNLITKLPYKVLISTTNSMRDSSLNKLKIFKFDEIKNYNKIIYCDCDILWCGDPNNIFSLVNSNKILVSNENHHDLIMTHEYWSGNLLHESEILEIKKMGLKGFNGGFFAFSFELISVIKNIFEFCVENIDSMNECLEQPFINVYLFRNNLFDLSLNKLITHNGYNIDKINEETIVHFAGGPGNYSYKMNKMVDFYEKNIKK
jgi:lipopolysaccharide biosynthesis glycosyltransferase